MANLLLIAESRARANDLRSLLRLDGHHVEVPGKGIDGWADVEREVRPDVVIASVPSTEATLRQACGRRRGFPPPLLFVHGDEDFLNDVHLDERLIDRIRAPFTELELLARVDALVRVRRVISRDPAGDRGWDERDAPRAGEDTRAGMSWTQRLGALMGRRVPRATLPLAPYLEVAARVAQWADSRDAFEPGHAERVTSCCAMIADGLGLGADETTSLLRAAMLHDIGKVALPLEMLHQEGPLEAGQMRLMRTHTRRGATLLDALDPDTEVSDAILYHHERPDGKGYYERGAEEVPRTAKALAVAEVFDAMTSSKVTRTVPHEHALGLLRESRGTSLDSDCVDALVDRLRPRPTRIPLATGP